MDLLSRRGNCRLVWLMVIGGLGVLLLLPTRWDGSRDPGLPAPEVHDRAAGGATTHPPRTATRGWGRPAPAREAAVPATKPTKPIKVHCLVFPTVVDTQRHSERIGAIRKSWGAASFGARWKAWVVETSDGNQTPSYGIIFFWLLIEGGTLPVITSTSCPTTTATIPTTTATI